MRVRLGSAEAPQDQVVVCVVSLVPDRYVLEQTIVYAQDVVVPRETIPQPWLVPCEEVFDYVLQALLFQVCCNPLVLLLAL